MYSSRNLEREFFIRLHRSRANLTPWLLLVALPILAWVSTGCVGRGLGQVAAGTNTEALIFYDWEDDMPKEVLEAFTAEFGIPVTYLAYQDREQAIAKLRNGHSYDVVVMDNREIPGLVQSNLLAPLTPSSLPNFKNISPNFRDLVYDPRNRYTVPYNWGTTGLLVRRDLAGLEVTRWADLWDPRLQGRIAFWRGEWRDQLGMTLKMLGYSANSEQPDELKAALQRLLEIRPRVIFADDDDLYSVIPLLASGKASIGVGWAVDTRRGREAGLNIAYILPAEGCVLWGDNFVIPQESLQKHNAELLLNYLLRPRVSAQIANINNFATPNEPALEFINPTLKKDSTVFPPLQELQNGEILLPLTPEGEALYRDIWRQFLTGGLDGH